jgi:heme-degrading monooxygenase HmoA
MQTPEERTAASPSTSEYAGSVTLINCFEVPDGLQDRFYAQWEAMNAFFRGQPGYVSNRLHRALAAGARYQFVNIAVWASDGQYQQAHGAAFRELVQKPQWYAFENTPGLYEVVFEASADDGVNYRAPVAVAM